MRAKKSLGQNFLKSRKALNQIVEAGNISKADTVLEIGPGKGVLTEQLVSLAGKVIAIEKDRELVPILQEKFKQEIKQGELELIEADILKFDLNNIKTKHYKLIANIPYYITGAIIEQFLSTPHQPETMVLLMQKEVAERIVARDSKESVLSIAVKAYGTPKIVAKVPAGAFIPAPKVDSAILLIQGISRDFFMDVDERAFFALVKNIFGKKRAQIGRSLGEYLSDKALAQQILSTINIASTTRPENIPLATWKKLTQTVQIQK